MTKAPPNDSPEPPPKAPQALPLERLRRRNFFSLVSLLERHFAGAPAVGAEGPAHAERIVMRHTRNLCFPSADVESLQPTHHTSAELTEGGAREGLELVGTFLGLSGASSPLPSYFAEELLDGSESAERAQALLDLFHHRLMSLLYRAVIRYRYTEEYNQFASDVWSRRLLALTGVGTQAPRLPPQRLLAVLPVLVRARVGAWAVAEALQHFLRAAFADDPPQPLEVRVRQFRGDWLSLPKGDRFHLGRRNAALGQQTLLGEAVRDSSCRVELEVGMLRAPQLQHMLPGGRVRSELRELLPMLIREPLSVDLKLVLHPEAVPRLRLGQSAGAQLGSGSWLSGPPEATALWFRDFCGACAQPARPADKQANC